MIMVIPTYWLTAALGDQHLHLRVPRTELEALLRVLNFNQAREVRYVLEEHQPGQLTTVAVTPQQPMKPKGK